MRVAALMGTVVFTLLASGADAQSVGNGTILSFPGIGCRVYATQSTDNKLNPSGYNVVGIKNVSGAAMTVACPIFGQDAQSANDLLFAKTQRVDLRLTNTTASGMTCGYYTREPNGVVNVYSPDAGYPKNPVTGAACTTGATSQCQVAWSDLEFEVIDTFNTASSVACNGFPANAVVEQYRWRPYWE
jgi:hypothetical protein